MFNYKWIGSSKGTAIASSLQEAAASSYIEGLITDYQSELLHLAMSYLNDYQLAQDCIQEVFITAYHKVDANKERASVRKWLKVCTINRCKSMLRSTFWRRLVFLEQDLLNAVSPARRDNYSSLDETGVLEEVMKLSIKYREVIILHYYQDMSLQEISSVLKIGAEATRTRLRRAKKQLKGMLKGDDINE
ncbi:sigma-70 family RNA polymerase sigma factor [Paenibacillus radicis (ex Xue et al. 2023)]|uniref:Sigma-70 family RNA polymerase sigma factor n=1 Tax=Paenibacillus radicis (ex Xue et al. 2023) TaxID=2972489 RepID=A0ABT1Y9G4_9BACL|nr:sigma-70 family RNA polymerase sigma factor [Paenibacillus radicis (ex Xue et al. 2023)]MCR8629812.1 sigma-70 family RNA polymerase sigma factor [Paenibacillus radicis (ex Xue et al. 2023)]